MRICELSIDYPPAIGGIAGHVWQLSLALSELGHQVHVVTVAQPGCHLRTREREGMMVYRMPFLPVPHTKGIQYSLYASLWIRWLRVSKGIELLHYHNGGVDSAVAQLASDLPRVFTNHSSAFVKRHALASALGKSERMPRELRNADFVIAPSTELARLTQEAGFPSHRTVFIGNGVDSTRFTPASPGARNALRTRLRIHADDFVVLCPRRLVAKNGVSYLVRAVPRVLRQVSRHLLLLIAGDYPVNYPDSEVRLVRNYIRGQNLGDVIRMLGAVPYAEMPVLYSAADVVVIPSLIEATSLAGLEGMACETAVLATNVGGLPEIIRSGEHGMLVPPMDSQALADGLILLLNDDSLRHRLASAARQRVLAEFTWTSVAQRVQEIYERAVSV